MIVHRTGPEGFPTPCCGISYSEVGKRGESHTSVEGDITCPGKTTVLSPERQRIEMLEVRVKQLEDTVLFMSKKQGRLRRKLGI